MTFYEVCSGSDNCVYKDYGDSQVYIKKTFERYLIKNSYIKQNFNGAHELVVELGEKSNCLLKNNLEKKKGRSWAISVHNKIIFKGLFNLNESDDLLVLPMHRTWEVDDIQFFCSNEDLNCDIKKMKITKGDYKKYLKSYMNKKNKKISDPGYSRVWFNFDRKFKDVEKNDYDFSDSSVFFAFQEEDTKINKEKVSFKGIGDFYKKDFVPFNMIMPMDELLRNLTLAFNLKSCKDLIGSYYKKYNVLIPDIFYSGNFHEDLILFVKDLSYGLCARLEKKTCQKALDDFSKKSMETNCNNYLENLLKEKLESDGQLKNLVTRCKMNDEKIVCHNLGVLFNKHGLKDDAIPYYQKACDLKYGASCLNLALLYRSLKDQKEEIYLMKACDLNDAKACFALSKLFSKKKRMKNALSISLKSCSLKELSACVYHGNLLEKQGEVKKAIKIYDDACLHSNSYACLNLGRQVMKNKYSNFQDAQFYFNKSCKLGLIDGCYALASYFYIKNKDSKARVEYDKLCYQKHTKSCYMLAKMNAKSGHSSKALDYLEKAYRYGLKIDKKVIFEDQDLNSIRSHKRFKALIKKSI
ncbi:sel1 repeat family protein [bacterium]|nr:sel1 repeat family protein [bacterium]